MVIQVLEMFVFNQKQTYSTDNNLVFMLDAWNKEVSFHGTVQVACTALYSVLHNNEAQASKIKLQQGGNLQYQSLKSVHQVCGDPLSKVKI